MSKRKTTAVALLLALTTTIATPAVPAYAFSVNDLLSQTTANSSASGSSSSNSSSGNSFMNILMGLLLGKLFSNMSSTGSSNAATPPVSINKIAGLPDTSTSANTGSAQATATGNALIATAKKYMGVPYVWGGTTTAGFDCSGFTQYVMKQNGITIPRTAAEQFATGTPVDKSQLRVGDLVFFTTYKEGASHVGFYMGDGNFIHASSANEQVTISDLSDTYYVEHYIGARRYIQN
ncbi:cell wall-associated NlpC family hydrolase [Anaerospora hongkongensis]|uniref:Cell wall-associated NlpC family hydrolase n=1 Tax=Anaerospora hongkongensis TaxID=244830 RepID=A0A4R1Q0R1_9FIRM|nr:C40 family peptidase [Anaerospora hongkongensis]TCL39138.1 cell wall-associated NlpC family hydrolase [Anaerospora hongkongensis]